MAEEISDEERGVPEELSFREKYINWDNLPYFLILLLCVFLMFNFKYNVLVAGLIILICFYLMARIVQEVVNRKYYEPKYIIEYVFGTMGTGRQMLIDRINNKNFDMGSVPFNDIPGRPNSTLIFPDPDHFVWQWRDRLGWWQQLVARTYLEAFGQLKDPLIGIWSSGIHPLEPQSLTKFAEDVIRSQEGTKGVFEAIRRVGLSFAEAIYAIQWYARRRKGKRNSVNTKVVVEPSGQNGNGE